MSTKISGENFTPLCEIVKYLIIVNSDQIDRHHLDVGKRWEVLRVILNMNNPSSKKNL